MRVILVDRAGLVIAILLHQLLDAGQRALDFFPRKQLSQLKLRCVHHLIGCRGIRRSFDKDLADKEIGLGADCNDDLSPDMRSAST